ncbi:MAG: hypothetical protein IMY70_05090 [Bacteroidetes bacterium]|nr:hypothetical protein [Bacteroidota bacterium]
MKVLNRKPFIGIISFLIVLLTMPLGHAAMILMEKMFGHEYVFKAALLLGLIGVVLLIAGLKTSKETKATFLGLFAGLFIWTGWIEFAYVFVAKRVAIQPIIENGEVVTKPEYLLMPSSIGFLAVLVLYFLFNGKTQCVFFRWWQRNMRLNFVKREKAGKSRPYALTTATEIIAILWFFYLVLLIVYDKGIFGDRHIATYIVAFGSLLWSLFLFIKLIRIQKYAYAIRYAIPTVIIFWTFIEILGRWNLFKEIWIEPLKYWIEIVLIFAVFVLLIFISLLDKRKKKVAS